MTGSHGEAQDPLFVKVLGAHFAVVLLLIALILDPPSTGADAIVGISANQIGRYYMFYSHVTIMIIVGFGFLMTFLKRHNYSSVSYNFMLAAFVFLWNMFCATFWEEIHAGNGLHYANISLPLMVEGMFGAGAVLITFGAVLGKTTPSQLVVIAFWEVIFYSFNFYLGLEMQVSDAGGSMYVHAFGAFFGVALAYVLSPPGAGQTDHPNNGATYSSDMFSMIGTTFLWIFWPSFNGALAADGHQLAAIVNTHLSLAGSVLATFACSYILLGKFDMVHIQNATLAGGVAMGSAANMRLAPWVSILIGILSGVLSTYGFHAITDKLRAKFNIDDTCGVHNLHGMPGVLGAIISVFVVLATDDQYTGGIVPSDRSKGDQAGVQFAGILVTLVMALVGGFITGKIVKLLPSVQWPAGAFTDEGSFELPEDFSAGDIEAPAPAADKPAVAVTDVTLAPADEETKPAEPEATVVTADADVEADVAVAGDGKGPAQD